MTQHFTPTEPTLDDESWQAALARPALVLFLVACLDVVASKVVLRFAPDLPPTFGVALVTLAVFAAAVAVVSTSILAQPSQRIMRSAGMRLAEVGLLLIATRLTVWLAGSGLPTLSAALRRPADTFFDPLFVASALVVGASWLIAADFTGDLSQLALQADELRLVNARSDRSQDTMRAAGIDRRAMLNSFVGRWVTFGLVAMLLATVLRRNLRFEGLIGVLRQDIEPASMLAILGYFLAGLLLIGHGQLALLRARWTLDRAPADAAIVRRWPFYVLLLIGVVALLAAFMPLGGTFLLARVLYALIDFVFLIMLSIYQGGMYLLLWLASLVMPDAPPPPPPPEQPPPEAAQPPPELLPFVIPDWLGGAFFWAAVALLVGYAAYVYFHDKGVRFKWLAWLWEKLRARWREAVALLPHPGRRSAANDAGQARPRRPWDFLRQRPHTPAALARFYYLSILRAAGAAGLGRRPAETPHVYAPRLEESLEPRSGDPGDAGEERAAVEELTGAFVQARYAGEPPGAEELGALEQAWRRTIRALRARAQEREQEQVERPARQRRSDDAGP
jgi:hypothetical protein